MLLANPDLHAFSKLEEFLINITLVHSIPANNYNKDTSHIPQTAIYFPIWLKHRIL